MTSVIPTYAEDYSEENSQVTGYVDVSENDWFYYDLDYLSSIDTVKGYADGTFRPDNTVTLGEFLTLIYNIRDLNMPGFEPNYTTTSLTDISYSNQFGDFNKQFTTEHWANPLLARALNDGLLEPGTYDLDQLVDRELATLVIAREAITPMAQYDALFTNVVQSFNDYISADQEMPETYQNILKAFIDDLMETYNNKVLEPAYVYDFSAITSSWYEPLNDMDEDDDALLFALDFYLVTGYPDGTFKKDQPLKRSEAITLIARLDLLDLYYTSAYDVESSLTEYFTSEDDYKAVLVEEFTLEDLNTLISDEFEYFVENIENTTYYIDWTSNDGEALLEDPMTSSPYSFRRYNDIVEALWYSGILYDEGDSMKTYEKVKAANNLKLRKIKSQDFLNEGYDYDLIQYVITDDFYVVTEGYDAGTIVYLNPDGINYYGSSAYGLYIYTDDLRPLTPDEKAYQEYIEKISLELNN